LGYFSYMDNYKLFTYPVQYLHKYALFAIVFIITRYTYTNDKHGWRVDPITTGLCNSMFNEVEKRFQKTAFFRNKSNVTYEKIYVPIDL